MIEPFAFFGLLGLIFGLVVLLGLALEKSSRLEEENTRLRDILRDLNVPGRDVRGRFTRRRPF